MTDEERIVAIRHRAAAWTVTDFKYSTATKLAHEDIPWLLDRLRATEAERDDMQDLLETQLDINEQLLDLTELESKE